MGTRHFPTFETLKRAAPALLAGIATVVINALAAQAQIQPTEYSTQPLIVGGKPSERQTMVLQAHSGSLQLPVALVQTSEGKPLSGTVAIADPVPGSDDLAVIRLENEGLAGSPYAGRKLVLEFDARDMSPLLGQGATYLIRPGISKLRLGNFFVSTTDAQGWCSVEITGPSSAPKLSGSGIKATPLAPETLPNKRQ